MNMINIVTSFFIPKFRNDLNTEREAELKQTLDKNLESPLIEKVHLFVDDDLALEYITQLNSPKIIVISVGKQPTYTDLFEYATEKLAGKFCMSTNSDIYLRRFPDKLLKYLDNNDTVFALSRYEHDFSCPMINNYCGSHDSFIFKSPLKNTDFLPNINHLQNVWGSESVLMYELAKCNIKIYNPCRQVIIVHLHKSDLRNAGRIKINHTRKLRVKPSILK